MINENTWHRNTDKKANFVWEAVEDGIELHHSSPSYVVPWATFFAVYAQARLLASQNNNVLQQDDNLAASFDNPDVQDSIKRQKLKERVEDALIANADKFLGFLSKTEDDPAFGRFFMGQMYQWFAAQRAANRPPVE